MFKNNERSSLKIKNEWLWYCHDLMTCTLDFGVIVYLTFVFIVHSVHTIVNRNGHSFQQG